MARRLGLCVLVFGLWLAGCAAPHPTPAFSAGERDRLIDEIAQTRSYTVGRPFRITITPDDDAVLFLMSTPGQLASDLYEFNIASGESLRLASAEALLNGSDEHVTPQERAHRERMRERGAGIVSYDVSPDGKSVLIPLSGQLFVVDRASGAAQKLSDIEHAMDARFSPKGNYVSYVMEHDLYCCDWRTGEIRRLTSGGTETVTHAEAEFVAEEEMDRRTGYWWSPDESMIAYTKADASAVKRFHIADAVSPEQAPQSWYYPSAGEINVTVQLGILTLSGDETKWVAWDGKRYPYLASVEWSQPESLTMLVQTRDQREELLLRVDAGTGESNTLLVERDAAWLNIRQEMPVWLAGGESFLWLSEADGEWRLQVRDADGKVQRVLNPGNAFRLFSYIGVDESSGDVYVVGAENAVERHIYSLPLSGGEATQLTAEQGVHSRVMRDGGSIYLARFDGLTVQKRWTVYRSDGSVIAELPDSSLPPSFQPRMEITRVGDKAQFDAMLIRPRNFKPGSKYPVLVHVYGGPSDGAVRASADRMYDKQWFADHGFVVVSIDNRGLSNRGRDWERAIAGNFGEIPLNDQVAGLQALGAAYPELDLTRVGIMGWSFGGYMSALAVERRGDVYHAAAAGAPVSEWELYDTHYTERYLGTPESNPKGYAASSLLTYAPQLNRPLLLIHGTADDNVYTAHSLRLADALFKNGKAFEFLPLAGQTHGVRNRGLWKTLQVRMADFFVEHLMGPDAPASR